MFAIEFTLEADDDLNWLRKYEQQIIAAIKEQLQHQPDRKTRNRKPLRPNPLGEWELRVNNMRIFYDVDVALEVVRIKAIGYKRGNQLFIHGEEYML